MANLKSSHDAVLQLIFLFLEGLNFMNLLNSWNLSTLRKPTIQYSGRIDYLIIWRKNLLIYPGSVYIVLKLFILAVVMWCVMARPLSFCGRRKDSVASWNFLATKLTICLMPFAGDELKRVIMTCVVM